MHQFSYAVISKDVWKIIQMLPEALELAAVSILAYFHLCSAVPDFGELFRRNV